MATIAIKGAEEYALKLSKLQSGTKKVADKAIYRAAGIVADQVKANIEAMPAVSDAENINAFKKKGKSKLTKRQKQGLIRSFGITGIEMDSKGYYNRKLGFDGYNDIVTRKYPKGQPNQLIARVVESGSSYMDKNPFIRPAVNATRAKAKEAMQQVIDDSMKEMMR